MIEKLLAAYILGAFLIGFVAAAVIVHLDGRQSLYNFKLRRTYQTIGVCNTVASAVLCVLVLTH
jgi:hypothetical protein